KDRLRDIFAALPKTIIIADIARDLDIDVEKLYNFGSKGYLNQDDLRALELWMVAHGYLDADTHAVAQENILPYRAAVVDPLREMSDLFSVLATLAGRTDLPLPQRLNLLEANLRCAIDLLPAVREQYVKAPDTR